MNLSLIPVSPAANRRTSPLAKVYTNDGRSIRVPIHPVQSTTWVNCSHSPERQFIRWFSRQSAADRGFPIMVKSILFVNPGTSSCTACNQSLSRFLQRFGLAHKLNVRNVLPQPACGCKKKGRPVRTELDQLLAPSSQASEGELEDEWYKKLAQPLLAASIALATPESGVLNLINKMTKSWVGGRTTEEERRQKIKEDTEALNKQAAKAQQESGEHRVLDEIIAGTFELEQEYSPQDVIHPNIDVHAQYAIQRMLKSPDPNVRADGNGLLAAVKSGQLRGIYKEDQQVPALRAKKLNKGWWQIIPQGEDAILFLDPVEPPLIVFRDRVRSDASRLDPALRKSWRGFQKLKQGPIQPCHSAGANGFTPVSYIVPAGYCTTGGETTDPIQAAIDFFCQKFAGNREKLEGQHCFDAVGNAMKFLAEQAPTNNQVEGFLKVNGAALCQSLTHTPGANCSPKGPWPMSNYSVIQYWPDPLRKAVEQLKCALDKGYVVRAGVLSGRCADKPDQGCAAKQENKSTVWRDCPEHWLLIIGYEDNKFVFWDKSGPSELASPMSKKCSSSENSCNGLGFGILHYDSVNNRLTTAQNDDDIMVSEYDGCHSGLRNGRKQKRYQVLNLYSGPYRNPIKSCTNSSQAEITLLDELLYMSKPIDDDYRKQAPLPPEEKPGLRERLAEWRRKRKEQEERKKKQKALEKILRDIPVPEPNPGPPTHEPAGSNTTTHERPKSNVTTGQKSSQFQQNRVPRRR